MCYAGGVCEEEVGEREVEGCEGADEGIGGDERHGWRGCWRAAGGKEIRW